MLGSIEGDIIMLRIATNILCWRLTSVDFLTLIVATGS